LSALALLWAGCQTGGFEPVALAAEDICAGCKMAISERQYAAQFLDRDGLPYKFDDLACLTGYVTRHGVEERIAVYFVMDYEARQWIKAQEAYYVRSPELKTPMSGGTVAFRQEAAAAAAAVKYHGRRLRFDDLFGPGGQNH
jgi:copper chaperone NosL